MELPGQNVPLPSVSFFCTTMRSFGSNTVMHVKNFIIFIPKINSNPWWLTQTLTLRLVKAFCYGSTAQKYISAKVLRVT